MCASITHKDQTCKIEKCDEVCRMCLTCQLANSSVMDILACIGNGLFDAEFGLDYLFSQFVNPWI